MARISGIDLPQNKRVEIALTYIHGIGRTRSNEILAKADVELDTKVKDLSEDEVTRIRQIKYASTGIAARKMIPTTLMRTNSSNAAAMPIRTSGPTTAQRFVIPPSPMPRKIRPMMMLPITGRR